MGYSFTDLGAEACCRSLNALFLLSLAFYKYSADNNMRCHDICVKFKTSKYHSKNNEIRFGLGVR